jgi:hypothetical protein
VPFGEHEKTRKDAVVVYFDVYCTEFQPGETRKMAKSENLDTLKSRNMQKIVDWWS